MAVEIVILFPLAAMFGAAPAGSGRTLLWLSILAFVIVLSVALAYAWANGHLDWMKPASGKPLSFKSPVPRERYDEFNRKQE